MASSIEWGIGGEKEGTWAPRSKSSRPVGAASRSKGNSLGSAWLRKRYQSPGSIESSAAASEANEGARWDQPDRASAVSPPVVHVALPPYLSIRLRCSALGFLAPASRAAVDATPVRVASARACVRMESGCVARTAETTSTTLVAAAPAALVAWPESIDVPLSGPKKPKLVREGPARARRGAPAVARSYRHLGPS